MPTPKKGARFGSSAQHQRHILSNLAAQLIQHGAIKTTDAKAKLLRPYVEKLITRAKSGSVHDRRQVLRHVPQKDVVNYLFDELAPKFENRAGGYTRIIKLENRPGDNAPVSQISLVLEETVSAEATRATRAAASKQAEETKAEEAQTEAPEVEADEATDAEAQAESEAVEAEESAEAEKKEDEEK
ncbi:50S ribosomal protein L17 [Corynebacterium guangdongense]|uniref:Large ribosomal subunit protein bL17 n=1 Tax=Corynebacterium guangdongense TaxID=1783348 RepID=A0ABU1ZUE6_9CORY|nr:50S ribosomal protein L17 [Corynebacterium guangdongense]MDR7328549.1 large subunit ribosomal protein L17 [Corynebacterium guangdongense]WJZ17126.1 50S ribosomal protein L17 [Corynebacterium guangdongense]